MGISTVNATMNLGVTYQCQGTPQGDQYQANTAQGQPKKSVAFTVGTTAAGKVNELSSKIYSLAASPGDPDPPTTATVDLRALLDVLGSTVSLARVKGLLFQLLSTTDDATNGTACTSVTIGKADATGGDNMNQLFLGDITYTFTLQNGEALAWLSPGATGLAVDGTHKYVQITNNDTAAAAKVQITVLGADA